MANNLRFSSFPLIIFLFIGTVLFGTNKLPADEVVKKIRSSILAPEGHRFDVLWTYEYDDDIWTGEGIMKILGRDYLKLTLDYQQILIKFDTLFTRYEKTDQVVADWFDRNDPANFFSILLGEMPGFFEDEVEILSEMQIAVTLRSETMVGFETLRMIVNRETWLPNSITAEAGEDIRVNVQIRETAALANPLELTGGVLTGLEFIDLRE